MLLILRYVDARTTFSSNFAVRGDAHKKNNFNSYRCFLFMDTRLFSLIKDSFFVGF